MLLSNLTAISPVDGRYRKVTERLADYFSEYALIRYRVRVEVEYFIALCELPLPELKGIGTTAFERLRGLYRDFSTADAERVKEIERTTNHDVKAVEYLLKEKMDALGLGACKEFVHFGLTSQTSTTRPFRSRSRRRWRRSATLHWPNCARSSPRWPPSGTPSRCWPTRTASPPRPRGWARS